mgnify:CR=1 FL=1
MTDDGKTPTAKDIADAVRNAVGRLRDAYDALTKAKKLVRIGITYRRRYIGNRRRLSSLKSLLHDRRDLVWEAADELNYRLTSYIPDDDT